MEEGSSNENNKKHPNIPSNYVTLLQLQERWIKEQQSKQKEKEAVAAKQNEESKQKIQEAQLIRRNPKWKPHRKNRNLKVTDAKETNAVAEKEAAAAAAKQNEESKQKIQEVQMIRRNPKWKPHGKNWNLKVTDAKETNAVAEKEAAAAVKQNEESKQQVQEAQPIRRNPEYKRHRKNLKLKVTKETNAVAASVVEENENESGTVTNKEMKREELRKKEKEEEEVEGEDRAQSPLVVTATRNKKRSETKMEYRPKVNNAGEMGGETVEEIDQKIGDVSIKKGKNRSSFQRLNRGNGPQAFLYSGYNTVVNRGNSEYRGGNRRFGRGDGQDRSGCKRFNGSVERKGRHGEMVWVRKEVAADGGHIAGSASSSKDL